MSEDVSRIQRCDVFQYTIGKRQRPWSRWSQRHPVRQLGLGSSFFPESPTILFVSEARGGRPELDQRQPALSLGRDLKLRDSFLETTCDNNHT